MPGNFLHRAPGVRSDVLLCAKFTTSQRYKYCYQLGPVDRIQHALSVWVDLEFQVGSVQLPVHA